METLREKATLQRLQLMIVLHLWPDSDIFSQIQEQGQAGTKSTQDGLGRARRPHWQRFKEFAELLRRMRRDGIMDLFVELRVIREAGMPEPVDDYETESA